MSVKIMTAVWENGPESASDTLMLLAIADHCDDEGVCYPSVERLARKCRVTPRGAQKIIRRLESDGWLSVEIGGGRRNCNVYKVHALNPERGSPPNVVHPERGDAKPRTRVQETLNPGSPEPSGTIIGTTNKDSGEFDAVWSVYPRKVGKGAAEKAWDKARKHSPFTAIAEPLSRYVRAVAGTDPQYIPHLATWLNQRRWEDEPDHASNRPRTSTDDLEALSRIPGDSTTDLDRLFTPQLRIVKQ